MLSVLLLIIAVHTAIISFRITYSSINNSFKLGKKAKDSPKPRINKFWNVHNRIFGNGNNYQHIEQPGKFQQAKEIK